jgi:hypothetical protein
MWLGILLRQRVFPGLEAEMPRSPEVPEPVFVNVQGAQESIPGLLKCLQNRARKYSIPARKSTCSHNVYILYCGWEPRALTGNKTRAEVVKVSLCEQLPKLR